MRHIIHIVIGQIGVTIGMGAKLHAGSTHLDDHLPGQVNRMIIVNRFGHQEKGGTEAIFPEQGKGVLIIIPIPIVKGEDNGLLRQRFAQR